MKYQFELEEIKECTDCPFLNTYAIYKCKLAPNECYLIWGEWAKPEWCPLKELRESKEVEINQKRLELIDKYGKERDKIDAIEPFPSLDEEHSIIYLQGKIDALREIDDCV